MGKFAGYCVSLGLTGLCAAFVACSDRGGRAEVTEPPAASVPQPTATSGSVVGKVPVAAGGVPVVVLLEPRKAAVRPHRRAASDGPAKSDVHPERAGSRRASRPSSSTVMTSCTT